MSLKVLRGTAPWCGPCRTVVPILDEVKSQFPNVEFQVIDVDSDPAFTSKYQVRSIPVVIIEKDDQVLERLTGVQSKETYVNSINKHM